MEEPKDFSSFERAVKSKKLNICSLDEKWHGLFPFDDKPEQIKAGEAKVNALLKQQGKLNTDLKDLKKVKNQLMDSVMDNMGGDAENAGWEATDKLEKNRQLIDDVNERIDATADALKDLPKMIKEANDELMMRTMEYCYDKLRLNVKEAHEIGDWLNNIRVELKRNIVKKQNREVLCRRMYAYMHDVFGSEVMDLFDLYNDDIDLSIVNPKEIERPVYKPEDEEASNPSDTPEKKPCDEPAPEVEPPAKTQEAPPDFKTEEADKQ